MLSACSGPVFEREETRPCPPVRMEATTVDLTRFRPGPGRDLTDVVLEAELTGYQGECQYDDDEQSVRVDLVLAFSASLGPAATERQQAFEYYVAIPRFYPDPRGKQVFESTIVFPENTNRVRYVGEELSIEVPLGADGAAAEVPVYIGFQLTPEQIEYNRAHATGSR
ncbi:hypothetical protein SAMN05421720_1035 [Rhodospira trueperi]|uniref:Uncharacterized protein n=2 Tax=Rhodospira trueperi TaxID=69960 RepID=A0A1G6ZQS9_9PROT|nr:hypothetical protein SAMN05421720_1035 [Rhodospira trueperi]